MRREARGSLVLFATLVLLQLPALAAEEVWRYTDERGTVHYSDSLVGVPLEYRHRAREVSHLLERDLAPSTALRTESPNRAGRPPERWRLKGLEKRLGVDSLSELGPKVLLGAALGAGLFVLLSALLLKLACKLAAPVTPNLSGACGVIFAQLLAVAGAALILALGGFALGLSLSSAALDSRGTQVAELSGTLFISSAVLSRMLSFPFARALLVTLLEWLLWLFCVVLPVLIVSVFAGVSIAARATP